MRVSADRERHEELLVALLEEAIYVLETAGLVPIDASLTDEDQASLTGSLTVVDVADVELVGAVPKAVARNDLFFGLEHGGWRCRCTIDV